jgi:hypothetical protein
VRETQIFGGSAVTTSRKAKGRCRQILIGARIEAATGRICPERRRGLGSPPTPRERAIRSRRLPER